ncbi:MAG: DUF4270 family protein [Rikenellaceae bacterium]
MREFKQRLNQLLSLVIVLFALFAVAIGCTDVNTDIGSDYASSKQEMVVGSINFDALGSDGNPIFTTRHYKSDSINVANQGSIAIGAQKDKYFGKRYNGFYAQLTPLYELDSDGFGTDPILDSVIIFMGVSDYAGDTTTIIKYDVYEVKDDSFLGDFNPEDEDDLDDYHLEYSNTEALELFNNGGILSDRLFSFYYPDQDGKENNRSVYISTTYMKVSEMSDAGEDFMNRLMLQADDGATYEMYDYDEEWEGFYDYYKGLYIVPSSDQLYLDNSTEEYAGATYKLSISSSGLGFYARTKHERDNEFIIDTIGMDYTFYDSYFGVGVNTVNVTYHDNEISENQLMTDFKEAGDIEASPLILVEGMGGIVNEITIEQNLFKQFAEIVAAGDVDNPDDDGEYTDIFFNTAILSLYVLDAERDANGDYQSYTMEFNGAVDLDELPTRLGLFYSYSSFLDEDEEYLTMVTAKDYDYYSEYTYSTTSGYDGYLNRSKGCYVMNIPLHLQSLWSQYLEDLEENNWQDFTQEEWDALEWNKLYVGPEASNLSTPHYAVVQGMNNGENAAPMRLQIVYTLLK